MTFVDTSQNLLTSSVPGRKKKIKGGPAALLWGAVSRCWTFSLSCSLSCREQPCEVLPGGWAKWGMMTNTFPVMGRTWPGAGQTTWPPHPTRQVLLPKAHCAAELSLAFQDPARPAHLAVRACCTLGAPLRLGMGGGGLQRE